MKAKKCPYCSKRISYISGFSSRRKSEYICTRCGKESKVIINKMIFVGFALAVAVAAGIMLTGLSRAISAILSEFCLLPYRL